MKAKQFFAMLLTVSIACTGMPAMTFAAEGTEQSVTEDVAEVETESETEEMPEVEDAAPTTEEEISQEESAAKTEEVTENNSATEDSSKTIEKAELSAKKVTVTFDKNGGSGTVPEEMEVTNGEASILPEQGSLNQKGYIVVGWSEDKTGNGTGFAVGQEILAEDLTVADGESVTLYAIWQKVEKHQVVYYLQGGELVREFVESGQTPKEIPTEDSQQRQIIGWKTEEETEINVAETKIFVNTAYYAVYDVPEQLVALETTNHIKYMDGSEGYFYPQKSLTRGETAQILYNLLAEKEAAIVTFIDVTEDSWYRTAIGTLATMGIMEGNGDTFQPEKEVTRAEFLSVLNNVYPFQGGNLHTFSDVNKDHPAIEAISNGVERGWVSGDDTGAFRPDAPLSRQEAVVILNRVLGRAGDKQKIDTTEGGVRTFFDVTPSDWAYYDILEASVAHEYTKQGNTEVWTSFQKEGLGIAPGLYNKNGSLFYVEETGDLARNKTINGFTFGADGMYTTGSAVLDEKLSAIVRQQTNNSMTQEDKLYALYVYTRDNYRYLKRPFVQRGQTGWEESFAVPMLESGKGNCYSFAALYYYLAKQIGYDAHTAIGTVGREHSPHGWVEINMNGTTYIFDPEMDMAYRQRGKYGYSVYKKTYGTAPFLYIKW